MGGTEHPPHVVVTERPDLDQADQMSDLHFLLA